MDKRLKAQGKPHAEITQADLNFAAEIRDTAKQLLGQPHGNDKFDYEVARRLADYRAEVERKARLDEARWWFYTAPHRRTRTGGSMNYRDALEAIRNMLCLTEQGEQAGTEMKAYEIRDFAQQVLKQFGFDLHKPIPRGEGQ